MIAKFPLESLDELDELAAELGLPVEEVRERLHEVCKFARERLEENREVLRQSGDAQVFAFPERPNAPARLSPDDDEGEVAALRAQIIVNSAAHGRPGPRD